MSLRHLGWLFLPCALSCERAPAPSVHVEVGREPGQRLEFSPESSLAEYLELPGLRSELRITLAGYALGCEGYESPPGGRPLVSVRIQTPPGQPPGTTRYAWTARSDPPRAEPSVRIGAHAYSLPPGGSIALSKVDLNADGAIEGDLDFEFPGDGERAPTSLRGRFRAKLCKVRTAESP